MGVSINELMDVIKKSGLPIGDKLTKTQQQMASEDTLRAGVGSIYEPQITQLDAEKKKKFEALANVDRQFSQLFEKGGKYQLENPMNVEGLASGGQQIALSDFTRVAQQKNELLDMFEKDVAKASSLYEKINPTVGAEGVGLADLKYLNETYGIELPNIDMGGESEWKIEDTGGDWKIEESGDLKTPPSKPTDIIKETPKKKGWPTMDNLKGLTSFK